MLTDDQRWDAVGVVQRAQGEGRFPWLKTATPNMDRIARRGLSLPQRLRRQLALLAEPRRVPDRPLQPPQRRRQQPHALPGRQRHLRDAPARRRLPHRLFRQVAHGQPAAAPRLRLATPASSARADTSTTRFLVNGVETPTTGWVDDVTHELRDRVHPAPSRPGRSSRFSASSRPHLPTTPPPRLEGMFIQRRARRGAERRQLRALRPLARTLQALPTETVRNYFRTLVGVDQNVGRVLDALGQTGSPTTPSWFSRATTATSWASTGSPMPDGNKRNAYEESIRIPLLLRYPRLGRQGTVLDAPVLNIDLAPTLLDSRAQRVRPRSKAAAGCRCSAAGRPRCVRHSCTNTSSRPVTKCPPSLACGGTATSWCATRASSVGRAVQCGHR